MNIGTRTKAREMALQVLYQVELNDISVSEAILRQCEHFEVVNKAIPYAKYLAEGVVGNLEEINHLIQEHAKNWRLERMSLVDRNIIRVAVFELCFPKEEIPATVVINEAIEVAKRFATDESAAFINGILDAIHRGRSLAGKDAG